MTEADSIRSPLVHLSGCTCVTHRMTAARGNNAINSRQDTITGTLAFREKVRDLGPQTIQHWTATRGFLCHNLCVN